MRPVFFYGSLRDHALIGIVLGRALGPGEVRDAVAPGFATRRLAHEAYPMLVEAPDARAPGVLLTAPSETDLDRLRFFEEAEYGLAPITVETDDGPVEAQYFLATDKPPKTDLPWDYDAWAREDRPVAVEAAQELMHLYGRLPLEKVDTVWPGIMNRARQRAAARAEAPALGAIRTDFGPDAVAVEEQARPYVGYLSVETFTVRHRLFAGGWSRPLDRTAVLWGDAVTVLPYDPARDRVLLIEQFRPGPFARGDRNPWCIEVVAGRIDGDAGPEGTVRREAEEEGGVRLGRLERIGAYYSTCGLAAEQLTSFVGEADLPHAGGVHGAVTEGEDIRAFVMDLDAALAEIATGAVNTAPAILSLTWLAANRARLGALWG